MPKETLLTVGIDLGTSTTQMVLSELTVENFASAFTVPRITISDKRVIYRSDIIFTPLVNQTEIDDRPIKEFVTRQYEKAGVKPGDIQMGAVIITGETARKNNSAKVLEALSGYAGDFVVATAGPDLESVIAGKGAGAGQYSLKRKGTVCNIDIGGGTSNLAVFQAGDVVDTACFDVGGRLIKIDKRSHAITYIAPKVQQIVSDLSLGLRVGQIVTPFDLEPVVEQLAQVIENSIGLGERNRFYDLLVTNHGLRLDRRVDAVTFSGGVADCLNEELPADPFRYGDIGLLLGRRMRNSLIFKEREVLTSAETIRATVVGAGSHTTEVSGSTIAYTERILPIKNLPVLKMAAEDESLDAGALGVRIAEKLNWYRLEDDAPNVALGLRGLQNPSFMDIQRYGEGIVRGLSDMIARHQPLIVIVQEDMAKALGHCLFANLPTDYPFVCLDSIHVENGDYIDIGMPVADGQVIPVIVKTLVFS